MYEASIRVPLIVHCPDLFDGGARRPEMILNIDFAPTFLDVAGAPIPDTMHGRSFHRLLDGTSDDWRDAFLYEYFWERAFPQTPTVLGVRGDRYRPPPCSGCAATATSSSASTACGSPTSSTTSRPTRTRMRNLLGGVRVETQAGPSTGQITQRAAPEAAEVFADLMERLTAILRETGALDEPTWRDATAIR